MEYCETKNGKKYKAINRQYLAASAALITMLIDGTFIGWSTPCLPLLISRDSPIPMRSEEISWMMAQMFVGQTISPIPTGYLMDWIGRKATMICLTIFPIGGWLLLAFATNPLMLNAAIFLAGLWIGAGYTVLPMYLAEIAEPSIRGQIITLISVIARIGIIVEIILGIYLPIHILPIISLAIPIFFLIVFPWMPESPYFHLLRKDRDAACRSLCWLRGDLTEEEVAQELNQLEHAVDKQMKRNGGFIDLVKTKGSRRAFMTVQILAILQRLAGMGPVLGYLSTTLPQSSFQHLNPAFCVLIIDLVQLLSGIIASFLVDCIGRRKLLMTSASFSGVMMYSAGMWYYLNLATSYDVTSLGYVPFVCFVVHGLSYSLGLGPVCSSIPSEYFPMNIKAKSSALTSAAMAFVSFFINKSYLPISNALGMYVNYWIYGTSCFVIGIFSWCVLIETKGKTLQQIQDELNSDNTPPVKKQQPPIYTINGKHSVI